MESTYLIGAVRDCVHQFTHLKLALVPFQQLLYLWRIPEISANVIEPTSEPSQCWRSLQILVRLLEILLL